MVELQDNPHEKTAVARKDADVLAELWITKATLNADANFDVITLASRANDTAQRLGFQYESRPNG